MKKDDRVYLQHRSAWEDGEERPRLPLVVLASSMLVALLAARGLSVRLARNGIVGRGMNKPNRPEVPEMGGLAIVAGFGAGVLLALGGTSFLGTLPDADPVLASPRCS